MRSRVVRRIEADAIREAMRGGGVEVWVVRVWGKEKVGVGT